MLFAEPLPKTNPPRGEGGEIVFCTTEEGVKKIVAERPVGKLLFVTDGSALTAFRNCLPPRAFCLVLDSEGCLPLFLSSDDVACVVAAGKESTLVAARFFAEVRKIPCAVFPVSLTFDGVYERSARVNLGKREEYAPLREARAFCDGELARPSAGRAYMRLLLSRLALFEAKALRRFGAEYGNAEAEESAYFSLLPLKATTLDLVAVALKNAEIRRCERAGMNKGEGAILAERIGGTDGEEQAFLLLSALYSAFFERGRPFLNVPDYAARAKSADVPYATQKIPTAREFARRAGNFERTRGELQRELTAFLNGETHYRNNFLSLAGRIVCKARDLSALKSLPEWTAGLCAVIRDFGLMDWIPDAYEKRD